jgi:transposase
VSIIGVMGTIAPVRGGTIAFGSLLAVFALSDGIAKRSRRTWSPEEKQRIVEETIRPGASVADVARRHGLNANLVFTWRRAMQPASSPVADVTPPAMPMPSDGLPSAVDAPEFVPLGVFTRADDDGPGLKAHVAPAAIATAPPGRASVPRPGMDERPGVIEIDLVNGTRLRVDAFVNERALRRVLAVVKAIS